MNHYETTHFMERWLKTSIVFHRRKLNKPQPMKKQNNKTKQNKKNNPLNIGEKNKNKKKK